MSFELTAKTEPGERLVALAEALADEIGGRASKHDREASFPHESLAAIKHSGYLAAPIPAELGGLGVESLHDVLVASSRLARGDAALTLGVNMHLVFLINVVRLWRVATASGDERRATAFGATIQQVAQDGTVFASAVSEPQQDLTRPATTATRTETGWRISGRKIFSTMSPAADVLYTAVTYTEDGWRERYGYAMVPRETPGVVVHDDWDAMGMRASGSNSVSFQDVHVPASALRGGFPTGDATGYLERNLSAGLFHAAAAVGIAESAHTTAVSRSRSRHGSRAAHADARRREHRRSFRESRGLLAGGIADRRALPAQSGLSGNRRRADEALRRGSEREALRRRRRGSDRRSGARHERWRRLPQRQPARTRVPRRPRDAVHASARRQPRLRVRRATRHRTAADAPLTRLDEGIGETAG